MGFLRENAPHIANVVQIHQTLVSGIHREREILIHGGGMARFKKIAGSEAWVHCKVLADIADWKTRLIKVDTDGFDLTIAGRAPVLGCRHRARPWSTCERSPRGASHEAGPASGSRCG